MVYHIYDVHIYQYMIKYTIFASQLHHYPAAPWPGSANIYSSPSEWYSSQPPPEIVHLNFKWQSSFYLKRTACIYACAHSVFVFCGDTLGCTHWCHAFRFSYSTGVFTPFWKLVISPQGLRGLLRVYETLPLCWDTFYFHLNFFNSSFCSCVCVHVCVCLCWHTPWHMSEDTFVGPVLYCSPSVGFRDQTPFISLQGRALPTGPSFWSLSFTFFKHKSKQSSQGSRKLWSRLLSCLSWVVTGSARRHHCW